MNRAVRVLSFLGLYLAIGFPAGALRAAHFSAFEPAPRGTVLISRPTVIWPLFLDPDTNIDTVTFTLNGVSHPIVYDPNTQTCISHLSNALTPGDYDGRISLTFSDGATYDKHWQFTVSPDAKPDYPALDGDEQAAVDAVNAFRKRCSLEGVVVNAALGAAADAHSRYMNINKQYGHGEYNSMTGYTGSSPEERVMAWGYAFGDYEDIGFASDSVASMVAALFDAPYHRIAFLQHGTPDFGYSGQGGRATLEFGMTGVPGVTIYPADGQKDVPVSWKDDEFPDPLRVHPGADRLVGYPITLFCYGSSEQQLDIRSVSLTSGDGSDVPIYTNRDANDIELHGGLIIFSQSPLQFGTKYTVKVQGATTDGVDVSRSWTFTTVDRKW